MPCARKKKEELKEGLDEVQKKILEALLNNKEPVGCKEIAEASGLTTPQVTGKMKGLLSKGLVESPTKGKYVITELGTKEVKK